MLLAAILALLTYTYTLGRLLGPLLALGLLVYASRDRWRAIAGTWLVYGLLLVPFLLFNLFTPDALLVRLNEAGYLGRPLPEVAGTFVAQLLGNLDPYRLLVTGDPNDRHHVPEIGGSMLVGVLGFALIGVVVAIRRFTADPFLRYLVFGLVASFIPASLTLDPFHVHRLIAVPVFAIALTIPAQEWLLRRGGPARCERRSSPPSPSRWSRRASGSRSATTRRRATGAAGSMPSTRGCWTPPSRPKPTDLPRGRHRADVRPRLLVRRAARDRPERFVHLPRDTRAPSGAIVLSSVTDCTPCEELDAGGFYKLYRIP